MKCPYCDCEDTYTVDSRANDEGTLVRRRRRCPKCEMRFSTQEKMILKRLMIVKKSGLRKAFEPQKIHSSVAAAMHKRDSSGTRVSQIANQVINAIESKSLHEMTSRKIGDMIMEVLAKVDEVAYIRYASVYKDFNSAAEFVNFAKKLSK